MPITYSIDPARNRVTLTYTGTISDRDLFDVFDRLYSDPGHRVGMDELSDLRGVRSVEVTARGLQDLAARTSLKLDHVRQSWRVAVVAPMDVVFGLGRMYELLREGSPERVMVFRDLPAAEQWLEGPTPQGPSTPP
jgi:hypothetical protein